MENRYVEIAIGMKSKCKRFLARGGYCYKCELTVECNKVTRLGNLMDVDTLILAEQLLYDAEEDIRNDW